MRRVVTGEELAQLHNPDPFAMPRWRAPVYRTPLGIILAVKFARLLGWIVRLIVRHPLAASVLALAAVTWVKLGWVTLVALVLAVVVMLAAWRWFWPGSFSRWVGRPARGKWRAWCYRRRWAAVMTIAGVAPVVSGPDPAARARQGHRHPVHRPGTCPAGLGPVRGRLRRSRGEPGARVRRDAVPGPHRQVRARWCWSSSAVTPWPPSSPPCPIPADPDLKALPVGRREDGLPWLVRLHGTHVLIAGATGAGKASLLWGLVRAMFPLMQDRPGPGPGRRSQADGAGLRPGHLRVLRRLRRRPGRHRRHARPGGRRHAGPGPPVRRTPARPHPHHRRTRSPWCWSMRSRS